MAVIVPDPVPVPTHTPFTAKHPVRRLIPEPNVDVAVAEIFTVLFPVSPSDRSVPGVVEPIPTEPPSVARYAEPVEVNCVVEAFPLNC